MSEAVFGLACPACQGKLQISEGERIVICPYCDQRSYLKGERGVVRYQIQCKIDHQAASQALSEFLKGPNRADGLRADAKITEMFVVYLPFWTIWSKVASWVFGKKRVDKNKYKPLEVKLICGMSWNSPARDVAEFGVDAVRLADKPLEFLNTETIYADGMVFEPMGSEQEPLRQAHRYFKKNITHFSKAHKIGSIHIRYLKEQIGIVFFPLWIVRYLFRERSYQVVIDGHSGEVLYGKVPGNPWYRAAVIIGSMALGMFLMVYGIAFVLNMGLEMLIIELLPMYVGLRIMRSGYNKYFRGEEIEIRANHHPLKPSIKFYRSIFQDGLDLRLDP